MDRTELVRLYEEAGTLRALGERLGGISQGAARARLIRAGIPIRDARGSRTRRLSPPKNPPPSSACAEWQARYERAGSLAALAREMGKGVSTIRYHLERHGVEIQPRGFAAPRTVETPLGPDHYNWKGGRTYQADGYVLIYAPQHPAGRNAKGYVLEHRLVMERVLGRYLTPHELVHHKNEVKDDNRPENLEIMSRSSHMSHHKEDFPRDECGRFWY